MSSAGAAARAAVFIGNARVEASRENGAKSRGPKTPEDKAHSAQDALTSFLLPPPQISAPPVLNQRQRGPSLRPPRPLLAAATDSHPDSGRMLKY